MVQVEAAHLFQDFVERCGASICKDLRGIGKEKPLCSCEDCIKEAIALLYQKVAEVNEPFPPPPDKDKPYGLPDSRGSLLRGR